MSAASSSGSRTWTVPLFPLDGVLLCPGLLLPLHIFEPRYQAMLAFAMAGEQRIAMAHPAIGHSTQSEHEPPVHEICGVGKILEHEPLADGRSNILLQGESKIRIVEELAGHPFRVVRGQVVPDVLYADADLADDVDRLLTALEEAGATNLEPLRGLPAQQFVDSALAGLPLPAERRLMIYSEPKVALRLRMLLEDLDGGRHPGVEIEPGDPRVN